MYYGLRNENRVDIIRVMYPTSNKTYSFFIAGVGADSLTVGDKIIIITDELKSYNGTAVTVVEKSHSDFPTFQEYCDIREIIAYRFVENKQKREWVNKAFNVYFTGDDELYKFKAEAQKAGFLHLEKLLEDIIKQFNTEYTSENRGTPAFIVSQNDSIFNNKNNIKGDKNMNMDIFGGVECGKVKDTYKFAMTLKGLAYSSYIGRDCKQQTAYVQYNFETQEFEDVTPFVLSISLTNYLYKIPVALSEIKVGDTIYHQGRIGLVKNINGSEITIIDPFERYITTFVATKNIFNFSFVIKIVNLMDNFNISNSANEENPFGNLLPMLMLGDIEGTMQDIIPFLLMNNKNFDFASNPMLMYFLMKDGDSNDLLPFFLMNSGNFFSTGAGAVDKN